MAMRAGSVRGGFHGAHQRRGFVIVFVLMMIMLSIAVIGWTIQRAAMRAHIAERQIEGYRRHHELLGVRDVVNHFLTRRETQSELREYAESGDVAKRVLLPSGVVLMLTVHDAQGTVLARLDAAGSPETADRLVDVMSRLPPDRTDLLRSFGPPKISLRAADELVVMALAGDNSELGEALLKLREDPEVSDEPRLTQKLTEMGFDLQEINWFMPLIEMRPRLWNIEVEALDERGSRFYSVKAELNGNVTILREWKALPDLSPEEAAGLEDFGAADRNAMDASGPRDREYRRSRATGTGSR